MIHYLLFTSIFTWIFIFFSGNKLIQVPILLENWAWDKTSQQQGLSPDNRNFENQLKSSEKSINGYLTSRKRPFIFQSKKEFLIEEDEFFEIPFFGKGFISYKKIGDKITYYSQDGEILWKKPSKSYPYSTWHGKINFLISGDGNQVLFIDRNGNPTGIEQADGSFLTDIAQTSTMGSLLLFSGGEVYRIDSNAELIFKKSEKDRDNFYFYKSASISENGNLTALHYIKNNEDFISGNIDTKYLERHNWIELRS